MTTKSEVEQFLSHVKEKIKVFDIAFRPRDKNTISLAELDILPVDRVNYIMRLKIEDYSSGPNKDLYDLTKPDYYEFGIQLKEMEVYIKLSLGLPNKAVDCMSFHIAEYPVAYPFKD